MTSPDRARFDEAIALVGQLAVRLEERPAHELDAAVDDLLAELGAAAAADRAYTFVLSGDGAFVRNAHEWCAPGIAPQIALLQAVPVEVIARWVPFFERGETIALPSVAALDPAHHPEAPVLRAQDIRSLLAVPLRYGGRWTGFVGFDAVRAERIWSPEMVQVLRLTAHLIGIALGRADAARATERRFDVMLELASATITLFDRDRRIVAFNGAAAERSRRHYGVELRVGQRIETPHFDADLRRALAGEEVRGLRGPEHRQPDVPPYWVEMSVSPVRDDDGTVTGAVYHSVDVSEQVRARQALERGAERRQALLALARAALAERLADAPLQQVLEQAVRAVPGAEAGTVLEVDADGDWRFVAAVGFDLAALAALRLPSDAIVQPRAAEVLRGPRVLATALTDPAVRAAFEAAGPAPTATLSVPVVVGDRVAAYLQLDARGAQDPFGEEALEFGALLGDLAGTILQRLTLEHDLHAQRGRLAHLAHHDALTGLPNRVLLADRLRHALASDARAGRVTALMIVDLDGFKSVNDAFGHEVGDALLVALAARLGDALRGQDTVARLGGDEFAVVAAGLADADAAGTVATKVLDLVSAPLEVDGRQLQVGASVGVAVAPDDGTDADALLRHADLAMYRVKRGGRGAVTFFTADLDARQRERAQLTEDLRAALRTGDGLEVAFQPLVRLADGAIVGVEALARWTHPGHGPVAPARFVPLAEEAGLMRALSDRVFDLACAGYVRLRRTCTASVRLALNVTSQELRAGDLEARLERLTTRHGLAPSDLDVEVTESVVADEHAALLDPLRRLRAAGARVAIDDFGTGSSSLHRLAVLPVDVLKIDRRFVDGVDQGGRAAALADGVLALARGLGLDAVAEGVETEAQRAALVARGCATAQGYLFARPLPVDELLAWCAGRAEATTAP